MPIVESLFAALPRDPRLWAQVADHATSAAPAWLWRADGAGMLWANAVGAAIFGIEPAASSARAFEPNHPAALEIARLAATLPPTGQTRLERLRGFGGSFGRAVTCLCWRVAANEAAAIFVVAAEPVGPALSLHERVSRLFAHAGKPLLVFAPDGKRLYATPTAQARFAGIASAAALGAALSEQALVSGSAGGATPHGRVTVERLGIDPSAVLVADFDAQPSATFAAEAVAANKNAGSPFGQEMSRTGLERNAATFFRRADGHAAERRHPLRFVWQMDTDGRFVVGSDEFMELMGPRTTAAFGRLWREIAADLNLDPDGQIARAVATRETWSGITVPWPVDDGGERLPVELSGLPVFDRDRVFRGYRGFGVCRDIERINQLARTRREHPIGFMAPPPPADTKAPAAAGEAESQPITETAPASGPDEVGAPAKQPIAGAPAEADGELAARSERPAVNVAPVAANVVPFPTNAPSETKAPTLSPVERKAFRELAEELTARLQGVREDLAEESVADLPVEADAPSGPPPLPESAAAAPQQAREQTDRHGIASFAPALLDRLPFGVLIYRRADKGEAFLYANRYLLELTGCQDLAALSARGGLNKLFAEPAADALAEGGSAQPLTIMSPDGRPRPLEGQLVRVPWEDASALALLLSNGEAAERRRSHALLLESAQGEIRELKSHVEAFKKTEAEMRSATREVQKAAAAKAEFVAKISHEIRTPLNAITGFAEVIMGERLGPVGNERYREYLKDIHAAGLHVVSLLNDLLDLSKIETGQLDLSFANVSLNELTQQCVGIMQPQASRARIIIRTSLTPGLPQVVADERSLRQIVLNLLSNSIRFTGPGGQVIVSTAFADSGEAILRVRDTGVGMSEKDVEAALEPFRQAATAGSWGSGGTGLGLPLTKALAEANRADFSIKSAPNAGTLIEVAFPPTHVAR
jgi:signal transduction histidine kinase/PAS domain-containing protein